MPRKLTQDEFEQRVYDAVGDEYTVLGKYITGIDYILMKHNKCGHEWKIRSSSFINIGNRCPYCANRKTHKKFIKEVYDAVGDEYTVLGEYISGHDYILMKHNKCGHEWKVISTSFVNSGIRCPECAIKKSRKTHKKFEKEVYDAVGDEYTVLSKYKNANKHILMKHNKCGHKWKVLPSNFINSETRCPECAIKKNRKTHEKFEKEVYDAAGDEYIVLSKYKNANKHILMKHNTCGHEWKITPSNFINSGIRCPKCINYDGLDGHLKSTEKFKKDLKSLHGDKIKVMSEYTGSKDSIDLQCNKCGHEWTVKASTALHGISVGKAKYKGCPECRKNKKREDDNNA